MMSGGHEVDVEGTVPDYKYGHNKPESTSQVEYSQTCERLESCLAKERSMKSNTVFECGPLPLCPPSCVHLTSFT